MRGHAITRVDLGGGLGIPYRPDEPAVSLADYVTMVECVTRDWNAELPFEPGRVVAGLAGVLLTRVIWIKPGATNPFVIVAAELAA